MIFVDYVSAHDAWLGYLGAHPEALQITHSTKCLRIEHLATRSVSLAPDREVGLSALAEMLGEQFGWPPG